MKKILVIDDQKDNLTTIKAIVKKHLPNCEVLTAISGKEGVEVALREQPDTILLDIIMPLKDGYEICQSLKENDLTKKIPVIMLSDLKTDTESKVISLDKGADAFLSKPVDPIELAAMINVMFRIKDAEDKLMAEKQNLESIIVERTNELSDRERIYRTLLNNLPGFAYRCQNDENWTMDFISNGCVEVTAYTPEDFINNKNIAFKDIIDPDYISEIQDIWQKNLKDKTAFEFEYPIFTKDKRVRWIWERGCGIYSDKSEVLYLEGFITDITDRKLVEQELLENENRLNILFEYAPDAFYINDFEGNFMHGNKAAEQLCGYTKEEFTGKNFVNLGILRSDEVEQALGVLAENIKGKSTGPHKYTLKRKDGTEVNVEILTHPVKINGEDRVLGLARDITERKKSEQALKESENRLKEIQRNIQDIVENSPDGIIIADSNGKHRFINKRLTEIIGYNELESLELTINDITPAEDLKKYTEMYKNRLQGKNTLNLYHRTVIAKSGKIIPVEMRTTTTVWEGEKCGLAFITDITERKLAEEELKKRMKELEIFNEASVDREIMINELRKEINKLLKKMGGKEKYDIVE